MTYNFDLYNFSLSLTICLRLSFSPSLENLYVFLASSIKMYTIHLYTHIAGYNHFKCMHYAADDKLHIHILHYVYSMYIFINIMQFIIVVYYRYTYVYYTHSRETAHLPPIRCSPENVKPV